MIRPASGFLGRSGASLAKPLEDLTLFFFFAEFGFNPVLKRSDSCLRCTSRPLRSWDQSPAGASWRSDMRREVEGFVGELSPACSDFMLSEVSAGGAFSIIKY